VFLSHASEDKDAIARPLYQALIEAGLTVWFDEAALRLGDSLRRKIDEGLARCNYGVVIISPNFLDKEWPQRELDGLAAREIAGGKTMILPVWHDIAHAAIAQKSPTLADRVAAKSTEGIPGARRQDNPGGPSIASEREPSDHYSSKTACLPASPRSGLPGRFARPNQRVARLVGQVPAWKPQYFANTI